MFNPKKVITTFIALTFLLNNIPLLNLSTNIASASLYNDNYIDSKREASLKASILIDTQRYPINPVSCDVFVIGASASGVTAAIQSARSGIDTCLLEETAWLGGMLTSAGVSSIDGSKKTSSGINKEFIEKVERYYKDKGIYNQTQKCKAGSFCYEPKVGHQIIKNMVEAEPKLQVYINSEVTKVYSKDKTLIGLQFKDNNGDTFISKTKVIIDATEYGDILHIANIPYDLGPDKNSQESLDKLAESCIQPITYVGIFQKSTKQPSAKLERPETYNPENFKCLSSSEGRIKNSSNFTVGYVKKYGDLPNNKVMLNIPSHSCGNDFNHDTEELTSLSRQEVLNKSKQYTLDFVYHLQQQPEFSDYQLYNEFDTEDSLALIPYVRESRRVIGVKRLQQDDILNPNSSKRPTLEPNSIAIGSYPIDLHFCQTGIGDVYSKVRPYQIPYEVLVPKDHDGILLAEKNISVSRIVNGSTRVQPTVMAVGQAAGLAAALSVEQNIQPRYLDIKLLQDKLIESKSLLFYFKDVPTDHYAFDTLSRYALSSYLSGYSDYTFRPNSNLKRSDLSSMLNNPVSIGEQRLSITSIFKSLNVQISSKYFQTEAYVTFNEFLKLAYILHTEDINSQSYTFIHESLKADSIITQDKNPASYVSRAEAIIILDRSLSTKKDSLAIKEPFYER